MSREDVEEFIQDVADGEIEPPGPPDHPICAFCGADLEHGAGVEWDVPGLPGHEATQGTLHFCDEGHKQAHKGGIVEGALDDW